MSFLEELDALFGTQILYEVLRVDKTASDNEIKKAYRRLSLEVHPDRAKTSDKDLATKKFQALSKVHSFLSDKDLRGVYDETGEVGDEIVEQERDWDYYWRVLFPKITAEDIVKFEKKYKKSKEELNDLKEAYVRFEGDMEKILENVLCATVEDEDRFRELIQNNIDNGELTEYKNFSKEDKKRKKARIDKAKKEAVEAEKAAEELGVDKNSDLSSMILKRQKDRQSEMNDFLTGLEGKYCSNNKRSKSGKKAKK